MATVDLHAHAIPTGWFITRGCVAAHGVLLGAVYLFLLHAPLQITSAIWQSVQRSTFIPGQVATSEQLVYAMTLAGATFVLGLAVFFIFPFIQGGILGSIRDRLELPSQPINSFAASGRSNYVRLLGSQGLLTLIVMVLVVIPLMVLTVALVMQVEELSEVPKPGEIDRPILTYPLVLGFMAVAMVLVSVAGMVYWMANCIVVAERKSTLNAWRMALGFCRRNAAAVLLLWLLNLVVGVLLAPIGLLGQWGVVTNGWALAALAVLNSAAIGYWGVIVAGMCMTLYLNRRPH